MSDDALPDISKSEEFAAWATGLEAGDIPDSVRAAAGNALLDFTGLCIAARGEDYVHATLAAGSEPGGCTALGHAAAELHVNNAWLQTAWAREHGMAVDAAGPAMPSGSAVLPGWLQRAVTPLKPMLRPLARKVGLSPQIGRAHV